MEHLEADFSPPLVLEAELTPPLVLEAELTPPLVLEAEMTIPETVGADYYDGPYGITPGEEAQRLPTAHLMMREDIVVGAIPSNYGLITWNGSTLTVS